MVAVILYLLNSWSHLDLLGNNDTVDQGMSVEEIERVIAQRVANAIEAIAIYETKTNMARKSIKQRPPPLNNKNAMVEIRLITEKVGRTQQPNIEAKKTGQSYVAGHGEKKYFGGQPFLCLKAALIIDGHVLPKCTLVENIVGHWSVLALPGGIAQSEEPKSSKTKIARYWEHKEWCYTLRGEETIKDPNNIKDGSKLKKRKLSCFS
ncbi:hypothetical protein Tco_0317691 [Tanacetum coccineum]